MRRLFLILLLAAAVSATLLAADVSGKWNFTVNLDFGNGTPVFTFQQKGESLTGTYSGALSQADVKGTVKGNRIEFEFTGEYNGQQFAVRFTGTIQSDGTMKGEADYGGMASGTWTAKRAK